MDSSVHSDKAAPATTPDDELGLYTTTCLPSKYGSTSFDSDLFFALDEDDDHHFGFSVFPNINDQDAHHPCSDTNISPIDSSSYGTDPRPFAAPDTLLEPPSVFSQSPSPQTQSWHDFAVLPDSWQQGLESSGDIGNSNVLSACMARTPHQPLPTVDSTTKSTIVPTPDLDEKMNRLPPKIGSRFSRESIQILKKWLALNTHHPYLSDEDHAVLQHQTGLTRTQISNWLTNARRKRNAQSKQSTFPRAGRTSTGPIDALDRPQTPAPRSSMYGMDPLKRWVDSPPENEPASVLAIARAIASNWNGSSRPNIPYSSTFTDEGSSLSFHDGSAASSVCTSSGGSFTSARSQASDTSYRSCRPVFRFHDRRRRRRRAMPKYEEKSSLATAFKPYQCTFCTEAFRTKHDWQRHEKSLHLSLEMWTCAPDGPRIINPKTNQVCCVFCGRIDPDDTHVESHRYSACKARPLEGRIFYRKDHLNQHLRLIHDVPLLDWSMKTWKTSITEFRSRCGFCEIVMNNWSMRVDHLAEHFKTGKTLADWKGDWGFEAPVLDMLKNAIPPYLIEMERASPFPFIASCAPAESPRTAYELITLELGYFINNYKEEMAHLPSDEDLRFEACRIVFASEALSLDGIATEPSWLRDLLMSHEETATQAKFAPLRRGVENKLCALQINGKSNLFEQCPLEQQLQKFVLNKASLGTAATVAEIQKEACCIIGRTEEVAVTRSEVVANWLLRLIMSSTTWLAPFCARANLPTIQNVVDLELYTKGTSQISSNAHCHSGLEQLLGKYIETQRANGIDPSDEDLGREARRIISQSNNSWTQTAANTATWLAAFKKRHSQGLDSLTRVTFPDLSASNTPVVQPDDSARGASIQAMQNDRPTRNPGAFASMMQKTFFLNDANCYRHVAQELTRFVTSTMSPNNPNRHVPSDAELQYQARWILFDSDDPWNQTAADNEEWLQRFKRATGILPSDPCEG